MFNFALWSIVSAVETITFEKHIFFIAQTDCQDYKSSNIFLFALSTSAVFIESR